MLAKTKLPGNANRDTPIIDKNTLLRARVDAMGPTAREALMVEYFRGLQREVANTILTNLIIERPLHAAEALRKTGYILHGE